MITKAHDKKHVLLVDDDQSVAQMLRMLLETRGFDIDIAYTGSEALEHVKQSTDLILLDLILPDQEGFDVCRKFKESESTRHIPIIILSGKLLPEDIVEGLYLGADDYLTKPFEYEELVARMEAVLRRGSIFSDGRFSSKGESSVIRELRKILDEELIVPFFQPIFHIKNIELLGFEALCRPKTKSILANPEILFKAAIQFGFYHDLEILSWKKIIQYAADHIENKKLFLNCNPYLVEGPKFLAIKEIFDQNHMRVENVVLELTERSAVSDFKLFYEYLKRYRDYGFQFAVDDVGGGYASLESIVETKPEVVKIDRHIISNCVTDSYKKSIVKFIVRFCEENNILSIAEGIESKEELETVRALGVDACQGYYLYKPAPNINIKEVEGVLQLLKK